MEEGFTSALKVFNVYENQKSEEVLEKWSTLQKESEAKIPE